MDALEFLKNASRMCKLQPNCDDCPLGGVYCVFSTSIPDENYQLAINIIEQWSKEHPLKTRQSVLLKQFPNAKMTCGVLNVCPFSVGLVDKCEADGNVLCFDCRKNFWLSEIYK